MYHRTSAWPILFVAFVLILELQTAEAFVCLLPSAQGRVARLEPKASSGPPQLAGSSRRQKHGRFFMTSDRVDNKRQAEGNQPAKKNLFDYIVEEDVEVLRRYVDSGGKVHVADALGDTAMLMAAGTGNVEVVKILASAKDADVNYACFHGGETPLMLACTRGYLAVAEYLVNEAGANVNAINHRGDTALSLAAYWGKVKCVKFLLSVPNINTEIENVQGKKAGEDMQELMRDESNDAETLEMLRASRIKQGLTR